MTKHRSGTLAIVPAAAVFDWIPQIDCNFTDLGGPF